ncbi:MAG: hypothetical protein KIT14_12260 [bacterium]|nr:hypothetical protein [bacterium]
MSASGWTVAAVLASALFGGAIPAGAVVFGGGGSATTDCLVAFDAALNHPAKKPRMIRCADGDPACDRDGVVNGVCEFEVALCANSTYNPTRCTLAGVQSIRVDHAQDNGDPKFDPDFQALQQRTNNEIEPPTASADKCTFATRIRVPLTGPLPGAVCKRGKKQIRLTSMSTFQLGKIYKDVDKLKLMCDPPPSGCDPQVLFTGTYDRIQRQIFNRSCALSGCHDSQTQAGNMLLEQPSAYANVVNVIPSNFAAAGMGWRRIDAANAQTSTSFLYRKITGDFGGNPALGARMPYGRPKLDAYLVDIVRAWIAAGAPANGWVPGTD